MSLQTVGDVVSVVHDALRELIVDRTDWPYAKQIEWVPQIDAQKGAEFLSKRIGDSKRFTASFVAHLFKGDDGFSFPEADSYDRAGAIDFMGKMIAEAAESVSPMLEAAGIKITATRNTLGEVPDIREFWLDTCGKIPFSVSFKRIDVVNNKGLGFRESVIKALDLKGGW